MPIAKPADGSTSWGTEVRAAIGAINAANTIYSADPPPGLTPLPSSPTADATAIVQSHIDALDAAGGGRVVLSKPGSSIRFSSQTSGTALHLRTDSKVQLVSDENTLLDFSQLSSGAAITVDDDDFTPLVGIRMDGGMFTPTTSDLSSTYTGISVTGVNLVFEKIAMQYFGRGIDVAHNSTFLLTFRDCRLGRCATVAYADIEAAGVGNAGENVKFADSVIANSVRAFNASANGLHLKFVDTSLDFCTEIGRVNNAHVHFTGCHVETNSTPYVFDVTGNSIMSFGDTEFVLAKTIMFKAGQGPANIGFGGASFKNCSAYFVNNVDVGENVRSEHRFLFPSGTTTHSLYMPWPLKWTPISAGFAFLDGNDGGTDQLRVTSMTSGTGQINLTASASSGSTRAAVLRFG
jgi:hypothetical protein